MPVKTRDSVVDAVRQLPEFRQAAVSFFDTLQRAGRPSPDHEEAVDYLVHFGLQEVSEMAQDRLINWQHTSLHLHHLASILKANPALKSISRNEFPPGVDTSRTYLRNWWLPRKGPKGNAPPDHLSRRWIMKYTCLSVALIYNYEVICEELEVAKAVVRADPDMAAWMAEEPPAFQKSAKHRRSSRASALLAA
jgi:hypothetical protein